MALFEDFGAHTAVHMYQFLNLFEYHKSVSIQLLKQCFERKFDSFSWLPPLDKSDVDETFEEVLCPDLGLLD